MSKGPLRHDGRSNPVPPRIPPHLTGRVLTAALQGTAHVLDQTPAILVIRTNRISSSLEISKLRRHGFLPRKVPGPPVLSDNAEVTPADPPPASNGNCSKTTHVARPPPGHPLLQGSPCPQARNPRPSKLTERGPTLASVRFLPGRYPIL